MNLPKTILDIANAVYDIGGQAYVVGGAVRDFAIGEEPKDYDVEVFGLEPENLVKALSVFGEVNKVGVSFGVLKVKCDGCEIDVSMPRKECKIGSLHTDFEVSVDPYMTPIEASRRRDFTINAMMWDISNNKLHDYHDGRRHLLDGHLHIVDKKKFIEDPLRVLRGMQFCGRFDMEPSFSTITESTFISDSYKFLPRERVWCEWEKWAEKSIIPSQGIQFLRKVDWLKHFLEINNLINVPQNPEYHPEGDVYTHTLHVCDQMAQLCDENNITGENRVILMFAALTHDFGKVSTTVFDRGAYRSPGHDEASVPLAERFLQEIGCFPRIIERVLPLVREHMFPVWENVTTKAVRRMVHRLSPATVGELALLMQADKNGRPPLPIGPVEGLDQLLKVTIEQLPPKIEPILMGRHLINLGHKPGKAFGEILRAAFEAQLDEQFTNLDGALEWLKNYDRLYM